MINQKFLPYHLVDIRPWPILTSLGVLGMTFGGVYWWHHGRIRVVVVGLVMTVIVRMQ
jgi:hypothetical protein